MNENTWGIRIVNLNEEVNDIKTILELNIGNESVTRKLFGYIKKRCGKGSFVVDLLDEEDNIIDDCSLTEIQVVELAKYLRHEISL